MDEPLWLSRMIVEAVHAEMIEEHGGAHGVRDGGLVESALARPKNLWHYAPDVDLASPAAAYGYGLARNHGFVDGNKRTAFSAMGVFLSVNGRELDAPEPEAVWVMLQVAGGAFSEDRLAAWVRTHI